MATFRQFPSGMWQARVYRNGNYESIGVFHTKKEAEVRAGEVEKQIYYNETVTDRNILFQDVIEDWFDDKSKTVKGPTLEQVEVIKRRHIEPYFGGKVKMFQITRQDIKDWIDLYEEMRDKNGEPRYSFGTRSKYLATLKDIFNHAIYEMEVLNKSPIAKLKVSSRGSVSIKRDVKYYKLSELDMLLDYFKTYYKPQRYPEYQVYYVLVYFLSRTGLRISEALALKWSDIDGNRLNIDRQTSRNDNNKLTISTLKTVASYRNIEIDDETVELLTWFRRIQQKMIMKYDTFKRNRDMIIFQTYNGNYMTPSTVRDTLQRQCLNAGVEYRGTHAFRHTHAVLSLEAGADLIYISRRLGHGSIKTTADTYLDITPQYESGELDKISSYLNTNMAQTWREDIN